MSREIKLGNMRADRCFECTTRSLMRFFEIEIMNDNVT